MESVQLEHENATAVTTPKAPCASAFLPPRSGFSIGGATKPEQQQRDRDRDLLFSWHRRAVAAGLGDSTPFAAGPHPLCYADSTLLESELEEATFPLFEPSIPADMMVAQKHTRPQPPPPQIPSSSASTVELAGAQPLYDGNSLPPSSQQQAISTLTSALQSTSGNGLRSSPAINIANSGAKQPSGSSRHDSIHMSGFTPHNGSDAMPISMNRASQGQQRRESNAGSVMGGISWGGVSVSSWVRDEYVDGASSVLLPSLPSRPRSKPLTVSTREINSLTRS